MKVGVIGTGSMGQNHVRVLSEMADLVGVFDANKEVGEKVAARFKTKYFPDLDSLLASGIEAVSIVTSTSAHYDTAKKAIMAGVNLLLEKPATASSARLLELARLAEGKKIVFATGFIERHNPVVSFAKKNLQGGNFGSLISAHSRRVSSFPLRIKDVGVIMDLGVHDIDVIKYLAGSPVIRVFTSSGKFKNKDYEDHANIVMEFENGVTGVVEVNWLTPTKVRTLEMTCSDQFVQLDYTSQSIEIFSTQVREFDPANLFDLGMELHGRTINLKKEEPLKRELQDFLQACKEGTKPLVTGFDAAETISVAEAAMESANSRRVISLPT
ncbi:MAG: Gfo/Idh/MocA family oxidoreductase [Methanomassiliicoccales archaeon]|nr:Gfo/Idh/MocA family oxidoreductase [Methanomassiliicoccales archaeon]